MALAAALVAAPSLAQTRPSAAPGWHYAVTPYAWLPSISGTLRYNLPNVPGGSTGADANLDGTRLLEALDFAAMIGGELRNGRYSLAADLIHLRFGASGSKVGRVDFPAAGGGTATVGASAAAETSLEGTLWTMAGGYTMAEGNWGHVDAQAGFRLFSIDAQTNLRANAAIQGPQAGQSLSGSARLDASEVLVDGIVGLRGLVAPGIEVLGVALEFPYSLDIGTGASRLTWQAAAGVGWRHRWGSVALGYRHLYYDQGGDRLVQDFSFSGPSLSASFRF
jgi:hypothetical protein